jgi:hypothetical protein
MPRVARARADSQDACAMKIVIEFYRTRNADDAHAIVGRETKEAVNTELARQLSQTLDMPQRPDAMTITDANGATLYSGVIDAEALMKKGNNHEPSKQRNRAATEYCGDRDLGK